MTPLDGAPAEGDVVLTWQVHLAREELRRFAVVILTVLATAFLAYFWTGSPFFAVVMAFALFGMLADFVLPTTFTLTTARATASTKVGKRAIEWKDVKRCYLDDAGIKLSPLRRRSRLEAYRGVFLRFGDRRDEVIAAVKQLRPSDE